MTDNFVDFNLVKQQVSIESVLDHYHIRLRRVNPNSLRGHCPLPTHSSEKSQESFCVEVRKKVWSCQSSSCSSERGGKKGGNILDLVALMESCSIRDAALKLQNWFISSTPAKAAEKGREPSTEKLVAEKKDGGAAEVNKPLSFTLRDVDPKHPYLRERGINEEIAQDFGVGYFSGKGIMSGRVVIPIHNEKGELVAYAGRSIDGSEPKYKFPAGFQKSAVLFNLHRCVGGDIAHVSTVVLVEGFFDCMNVHQAGYPCVALMGSSLSTEQEKLLASHFTDVLIMLDPDEAGGKGSEDCLLRLGRSMWVKMATVPAGKQPDQLSSEEIKTILG